MENATKKNARHSTAICSAQLLMLVKPSTQLTMHTHPSAGVYNALKFALSHEEEEEEV